MRGLTDKKVMITGAASGIGLATAQRFYAEGCHLLLNDMRPLEATELATRFPERMQYVAGDVSSADVRTRLFVLAEEKGLDVLVNNAGITRDASALKLSDENWDQVIAVNLTSVFRLSQQAGALMKTQGRGGAILSAASVVAHYGNFGQANYVAAKAGVIGLTKTLAREWGRYGIRVNAVAPGFIDTPMARKVPADIQKSICDKMPLGRFGDAAEIASVYAFLASDESSYITGTCIHVDGGLVV